MQTLGAGAPADFSFFSLFYFSAHLQFFLNFSLLFASSLTYVADSVPRGLGELALNLGHPYVRSGSLPDQVWEAL